MSAQPIALLNLPYAVSRRLVELMPFNDLIALREVSKDVTRLSKFRGEAVYDLFIAESKLASDNMLTYSKLLARQSPITPLDTLHVDMSADICTERLIQCLDSKVYSELYLYGNYHWKQLITLMHQDIYHVDLNGRMEIPPEETEEFFKTIATFKFAICSIECDNANRTWWNGAIEAWNSLKGTLFKEVDVDDFLHYITATGNDNQGRQLHIQFSYEEDELDFDMD